MTILHDSDAATTALAWVVFDDGSPDELARWTDDGTVRVVSVAPPGQPQRLGDELAVERVGEPGAGGLAQVRPTAIVKAGGYCSFAIVGAHPGPKLWAVLERQLSNRGWALWVASDGRETIRTPSGLELTALRAYLGVPVGTSLVEIDAVLHALTGDWATPPTWLELATLAGGDVSRHRWAR